MLGSSSSMGSTASEPNANRYGVSPVDVLWVVLYPQSTLGISSAHFPGYLSIFFLRDVTMVLFMDSTCPFDWGWATDV